MINLSSEDRTKSHLNSTCIYFYNVREVTWKPFYGTIFLKSLTKIH